MDEQEATKLYDEYLDELPLESVISYPTSYVLKEVDPTAYDCGFADFCDSQGIDNAQSKKIPTILPCQGIKKVL